MTERLSDFAMENHELCRVWLLQVLASPDASKDAFWREYCGFMERFAASYLAVPGIDAEILSVMNLARVFLWPIWARAHDEDGKGHTQLAHRFARECVRLAMYGSMRTSAFPEIAERFDKQGETPAGKPKLAAAGG